MSSEALHIPREQLSREARLLHYAIVSLQEELDAVDWYRQRADDTENAELKAVLLHNMREEIEHSAMLIEWLRRNNPDFAGALQTYLYTTAPITAVEAEGTGENAAADPAIGASRARGAKGGIDCGHGTPPIMQLSRPAPGRGRTSCPCESAPPARGRGSIPDTRAHR